MPKANTNANRAHSDNSGRFSIIGVAGTLGTADITGSAPTVNVGVDPLTGAMYTSSVGGQAGTNVNIVTGTQQTLGTVGTIIGIGTITGLSTGTTVNIATGTQQTLGTVGVVNNFVTGTLALGTVVGNVASGATDSGNPVKVGGIYGTTAPTLTDLQRGNLQLDVNANLKITEATLLAGEDLTNNVIKVEQRFSYTHIAAAVGTTVVKAAAGFLHSITLNGAATATNVTNIIDSAAGTTSLLIAVPAATTATVPTTLTYDVSFVNGLVIEAKTAAGASMTVSYR